MQKTATMLASDTGKIALLSLSKTLLHGANPRQARAVGTLLRELADAADHQADLIEQERETAQNAKKRLKRLNGIPLEIERDLAQGLDLARALDTAAGRHQVPLETVTLRWQLHQRPRRRMAKEKRNREILRLARRGWSNAELARHFGLAPSTVSRIVADALRAR